MQPTYGKRSIILPLRGGMQIFLSTTQLPSIKGLFVTVCSQFWRRSRGCQHKKAQLAATARPTASAARRLQGLPSHGTVRVPAPAHPRHYARTLDQSGARKSHPGRGNDEGKGCPDSPGQSKVSADVGEADLVLQLHFPPNKRCARLARADHTAMAWASPPRCSSSSASSLETGWATP